MKIALIVEQNFYGMHVGVRNLILTVYLRLIKNGHKVDFVTFYNSNNKLIWCKYWFDINHILNNFSNSDVYYVGTPNEVLQKYQRHEHEIYSFKTNDKILSTTIGQSLDAESYDACFFTTPWLDLHGETVNIKKKFGIVYDLIPNIFTVTKENKHFIFANQHLEGFRMFNRVCDKTLCISKATSQAYNDYLAFDSLALPPCVPNYIDFKFADQLEKTNNTVVLAGPFDVRKGLYRIADLLNGAVEHIDEIIIYGKQRCSDEELRAFINKLTGIDKIHWYESVTSKTLAELYKKSKVLIFPSDEEGLGLPLIEAQLHGCRVLCTNFSSAAELLVDGYKVLPNEQSENDVEMLINMLNEDYDYKQLLEKSRNFYNILHLDEFLDNILTGD
ncbi:glycosyl transferase group 1 [Denitrovibrio acetiphilus DSM 12809]|uniref:Glycosyl transferase group 1 n=1 Tax=Denitrovibrio acetiphilus (strain DSM 12809 / NBRC 114555 / N2460) TaxID=522772 RepID=D4H589_DENA2|nr:glycosyltransferase family 4 protein [Denitrovibrio acetiphilus]ADD69445.1 glycosyl transferase group 1 [Denitrovibrio acetiphilus DSM 12809]